MFTVLASVLLKRLHIIVTVNEMQCGSVPERGTMDAVSMLNKPQEEYHANRKKMCLEGPDKVFDRVPRKVLE